MAGEGGRELVLIGGGGHALVVAEAAILAGRTLAGYLDDDEHPPLSTGEPRARRLGPLAAAEHLRKRDAIIAVGNPALRERVAREHAGADFAVVVHPRAVVSPSAAIAPGAFLGPGAVVHTRARVGAHAIINSAAVVEHDCAIGENAHVAPGAILGGGATVGALTLVGLGARVLPLVRVGARCTIGAGAVVTRDVPDGATVAGVPARPAR